MRNTVLPLAVALGLVAGAASAVAATATCGEPHLPSQSWSFNGAFGTYDRAAVQRGFQVYKEVCAACHGMQYLYYRNLAEIGFSEAQVKAIAAEVEVTDGPNDQGEMFTRPGRPSDRFKSPFANPQAARAANNGALPPDLSLVAKARKGGPDYLYAILTGYREPPAEVKVGEGQHYNAYFAAGDCQIAMPAPLAEGQVEYTDGTKASLHQMARDVSSFLMWAAEPGLEDRHRLGVKVVIFLLVLTGLLYLAKRAVWRDLH
jgi:ubiquinol-cytochrome c reductase cytochrome c1 subunit